MERKVQNFMLSLSTFNYNEEVNSKHVTTILNVEFNKNIECHNTEHFKGQLHRSYSLQQCLSAGCREGFILVKLCNTLAYPNLPSQLSPVSMTKVKLADLSDCPNVWSLRVMTYPPQTGQEIVCITTSQHLFLLVNFSTRQSF